MQDICTVWSFTPRTFPRFWIFSAAVCRRSCGTDQNTAGRHCLAWPLNLLMTSLQCTDYLQFHSAPGSLTVLCRFIVLHLCKQGSLSQLASEDSRHWLFALCIPNGWGKVRSLTLLLLTTAVSQIRYWCFQRSAGFTHLCCLLCVRFI